jgi:hypothetical protein
MDAVTGVVLIVLGFYGMVSIMAICDAVKNKKVKR